MRNSSMVCKYCGKQMTGPGCQFSPDGYHELVGDNDHCVRCGSTNYGGSCMYPSSDNWDHIHVHGHGVSAKDGRVHCIYCGKDIGPGGYAGSSCIYSPTGRHEG